MLNEIRERVSETELEQIVTGVAHRMAAQAPQPGRNKRPSQILEVAVRYLNEHGYVARWEKTAGGQFVMHTCNCPYERVSHAHSEVCEIDANLIGELVGVEPERLSHMAKGDNSCSYVLSFQAAGDDD
jgi:predicted ArsR family transcriptional regulator